MTMCYYDDAERCTVWTETHPRARRAHTCDLCRLRIVVGAHYTRITSLFDGGWSTATMHDDCRALSLYIQLVVCGQHVTYIEGPLRAEVREHMFEAPEVLYRYRDVLRARRTEGVWPVPAGGAS